MMKVRYRDGNEIIVGDNVAIDESTSGTVEAIADDFEWTKDPSDRIGVYVATELLGLVRVSPGEEGLRLLRRKETSSDL
jgi:hypothetical protein